MNFSRLLFIAVLTSVFTNVQNWKLQDSLPQGSLLNRFFNDTSPGNNCTASRGVYKTYDDSASWITLTNGTFTDPDTSYVVGESVAKNKATDDIENDEIIISYVTVINITCNGDADGSIIISASGGIGALQYSIDGGITWFENNGIFVSLAPGYYTIGVKDENNNLNILNDPISLFEPPAIIISSIISTDVSHMGGNDGSISINAEGGHPLLQYSIDNGTTWQMNPDFTGLVAGNYIVVVKDYHNCRLFYLNNPVIITEFPLSIGSLSETEAFSIYPNPATSKILLTSLNVSYQYSVCISTISGQLLVQNVYFNQNKIEMDISTLYSGIYILKIQTNKGVETKKIIVQ